MWAAPVRSLPRSAGEVAVVFRPEMVKACVFDMFGTLFNVHSSVAACQEAFAEEADEHLAVVEALIAGQAKDASRAMARHIRAGVKYWSRGLPTEQGI